MVLYIVRNFYNFVSHTAGIATRLRAIQLGNLGSPSNSHPNGALLRRGQSGRGVRLAIPFHLMPRVTMHGAISQFPHIFSVD
jgi:hypothetical protein